MYIITSGMNPNEDHLEHHGVIGMKWGVHRYRDKSGNITKRGKKRFEKVAKDKDQASEDAWRAKRIAESRRVSIQGRIPTAGQKKMANKLIKDIDSGKIKAGRDFIVQVDKYFGMPFSERHEKVIFKDKSGYENYGIMAKQTAVYTASGKHFAQFLATGTVW